MLHNPSQAPYATQIISGKRVAHLKHGAKRRAIWAADYIRGHVRLTEPTVLQASALFKVSPTYIEAALKVVDDGRRLMVLKGYQPLIPPKPKSESLASRLARATPAERIAAARKVGIEAIWDSMIVPLA
jgi:hypothetical protein